MGIESRDNWGWIEYITGDGNKNITRDVKKRKLEMERRYSQDGTKI